jgi:hypothetical protein
MNAAARAKQVGRIHLDAFRRFLVETMLIGLRI